MDFQIWKISRFFDPRPGLKGEWAKFGCDIIERLVVTAWDKDYVKVLTDAKLFYFISDFKHVDLYVNYREFVRNRVPVAALGNLKPENYALQMATNRLPFAVKVILNLSYG